MIKIAIDFGSSVTKIYQLGSGVVLAEASVVAVNAANGDIKAIGNDAKRLIGKTSESTSIIFPVFEAEIVNENAALSMLRYFLNKINLKPFGKKVDVVFGVPCGFSAASRSKYYRLSDAIGFKNVDFVETPILSALGQNIALNESNPCMVLEIGGGCTSISAFSLDGVIAGLSLNVGGGNIDSHIIDSITEQFDLKIGLLSSEKLKVSVGSLYYNDDERAVVNGRDIITGKPKSVSVSSEDIYRPIALYFDKILEYTEMLLKKLPAEVSAAVSASGLYLSGGMSQLAGAADYISSRMNMDVNLAEEPQMAVVLGGGRAIGNDKLLEAVRLK